MSYWEHFKKNMAVAIRSQGIALIHALHAFVPVKFTSHEYWEKRR